MPLPPWVAMRRPLSSTRVLFGPRPRSEANEAPPLTRSASAPNTLLPEVALSAPVPFEEIVRISCSALVMPCFSMSSKVMTWTGSAPSLAIRLMLLARDFHTLHSLLGRGFLRDGGADDANQGDQVGKLL